MLNTRYRAAIWHYTDGIDLNTVDVANFPAEQPARDAAQAFVAEADAAGTPSFHTNTLALTLSPQNPVVAVGQTVTFTVDASADGAGGSPRVQRCTSFHSSRVAGGASR